jgi:hypothetical protein
MSMSEDVLETWRLEQHMMMRTWDRFTAFSCAGGRWPGELLRRPL